MINSNAEKQEAVDNDPSRAILQLWFTSVCDWGDAWCSAVALSEVSGLNNSSVTESTSASSAPASVGVGGGCSLWVWAEDDYGNINTSWVKMEILSIKNQTSAFASLDTIERTQENSNCK